MTPKSLEELISELPASERAAIAWMPRAISLMLERLLSAPELTPQVGLEVSRDFFGQVVSLPGLLRGLRDGGQDEFLAHLPSKLRRQLDLALQLPIEVRRPAMRALTTWMVAAGATVKAVGAELDVGRPSSFFELERELLEIVQQEISRIKGFVFVIAMLHGLETGRARDPRVHQLAVAADREAHEVVKFVVAAKPEDPRLRVPWYFEEGKEALEFKPIASWAEVQTRKNDRALSILERWSSEPEDPDEREQWKQVKRELDLDRPSNRPLFP